MVLKIDVFGVATWPTIAVPTRAAVRDKKCPREHGRATTREVQGANQIG